MNQGLCALALPKMSWGLAFVPNRKTRRAPRVTLRSHSLNFSGNLTPAAESIAELSLRAGGSRTCPETFLEDGKPFRLHIFPVKAQTGQQDFYTILFQDLVKRHNDSHPRPVTDWGNG